MLKPLPSALSSSLSCSAWMHVVMFVWRVCCFATEKLVWPSEQYLSDNEDGMFVMVGRDFYFHLLRYY